MTVLFRELRAGLKTFIFWLIGLFAVVFIGIMKFQGVSSGGVDFNALMTQFPKIVQAVMGTIGVDITTLSGYTAILTYYTLIMAVLYAIHLGSSAVSREFIDKTYEFIFTKPCSRARVLAAKLAAAWCYLVLFSLLFAVFSAAAAKGLPDRAEVSGQILVSAAAMFLISSLFLALSAFISAVMKRPESGALIGNMTLLYAFFAGVGLDMLNGPAALRVLSPLRFFTIEELTAGSLNLVFAGLTLLLTAALVWQTFVFFIKRDLL